MKGCSACINAKKLINDKGYSLLVKKDLDNEESEIEDSSNDEIEINEKPKKERKTRSDKKEKPPKVPYVYTEKRQENIKKAIETKKIKMEMKTY